MDNRINFPPTKIDFAVVGTTGQAHDSFPAAGAQPRYDWFRLYLIGLLANQSSDQEPTEYREGTLWFDLATMQFKVFANSEWKLLADVINLTETQTLADWFTEAEIKLTSLTPEITFSGLATTNNITDIAVPSVLHSNIDVARSRPFVYINGLFQDPRNIEFQTVATIKLKNGVKLDADDKFTVMIRAFSTGLFHVPTVSL